MQRFPSGPSVTLAHASRSCSFSFSNKLLLAPFQRNRPPIAEILMQPKLRWCCLLIGVIMAASAQGANVDQAVVGEAGVAPDYVGSQSCRECHERFYGLWSTSHHGLAMQPFTGELARQQLTSQTAPIAIGNYRYRADPLAARVDEEGSDGPKSYRITHTLGGKNVYYFLTPLERGRLQVLPISYDVNRREWFDTAASAVRHFGIGGPADSPVLWREPVYTFNTSCYDCHVSQLARNYDAATDTYRTAWAEPGINCETCHGPAGEHVRSARAVPAGGTLKEMKLIVTRTFSSEQTNAMCGSCHAKLTPLTESFKPGERFFDHFGLTALEDTDFYPDGRDLGENFTYTTWRLSPCQKSGQLDCVDCHTSSGRYKFRAGDPNAACLPCHTSNVKAVAEHSHHAAGSTGAQCVSCHMPMTEFSRMRRSDHSMRPPTPAATIAFGSPNACNLCHADKDAAWADRLVRNWHENDYQAPVLQRARLIDAARNGDWTKLPDMVAYLNRSDREEIWTTSLVRLLRGCDNEAKWPVLLSCLKDRSPLVRAAAVDALGDRLQHQVVEELLAATRDEFRLVRTRAAAVLAALPRESLADDDRRSIENATLEYLSSLQARPDDWTSHYNLGNYYMERQQPGRAVDEFSAAVHFQPQSLPPLVNRAMAYATLGKNDDAERSLRQALALDPMNAATNLNLGMLLAELGRLPEAEQAFRLALKSDPHSAVAAYNLGVLLAKDRPEESLEWCRKAAALRPQEARYGYTLGFFLNQQGKVDEAIRVLEETIRQPSPSVDAFALLGESYLRQGRRAEAAAVYRRAAADERLPATDRAEFDLRVRRLLGP